jgi:hypothetical protein
MRKAATASGGDLGVPGLEIGLDCVPLHVLAVGTSDSRGCIETQRLRKVVGATGKNHARRQSLEVPLPRPWQCLVEVADVKCERQLRSTEEPEIHNVGIATELDCEYGPWRGDKIGCHDRAGAAQEIERRTEHASVPCGNQIGYPTLVLGSDSPIGSRSSGAGKSVACADLRYACPAIPSH